jgi:hypothetical protein
MSQGMDCEQYTVDPVKECDSEVDIRTNCQRDAVRLPSTEKAELFRRQLEKVAAEHFVPTDTAELVANLKEDSESSNHQPSLSFE